MKNFKILMLLMFFITSCSLTVYDDINHYKGWEIINIDTLNNGYLDDVKIGDNIRFVIKNPNGDYRIINLKPSYDKSFKIGDTI